MQFISLCLALLACGSGLWAAREWFVASRIPVAPSWIVEPGEVTASLQGWVAASMAASAQSSRLNARAAIWTGVSVALSGLLAVSSVVKF